MVIVLAFIEYYMCMPSHSQTDLIANVHCRHCSVCVHVNVKTMSITIGEVIHGLNIMKCMDSDIDCVCNTCI